MVEGNELMIDNGPSVMRFQLVLSSMNTDMLFLYSIYRLFFMLKRFPIESVGRQKKLHEVIF